MAVRGLLPSYKEIAKAPMGFYNFYSTLHFCLSSFLPLEILKNFQIRKSYSILSS